MEVTCSAATTRMAGDVGAGRLDSSTLSRMWWQEREEQDWGVSWPRCDCGAVCQLSVVCMIAPRGGG
ncbi:hypothetical protein E2C01_084307 [Portunus trituberculatus]|uniref:Uncharacterized protein n=1 Tax=Portunus trituberculatus TaxID=210409 RepID=A0A5B7J3P1_PORTR|nr:hypothetical protein [Portunus trituberculatus]